MKISRWVVLFSCMAATLCGSVFDYAVPVPIQGFSLFGGNAKGYFAGDVVIELADGSAWKVHPDNREAAENWQKGEAVHVQVRNSFYWLKREHKFRLFNHDRSQSVKVMLLRHQINPLEIIEETEPFSTKVELEARYEFDEEGNLRIIGYDAVLKGWKKILRLNDGTQWEIRGSFNKFIVGSQLYVGVDDEESCRGELFIIAGRECWAEWTSIYPVTFY